MYSTKHIEAAGLKITSGAKLYIVHIDFERETCVNLDELSQFVCRLFEAVRDIMPPRAAKVPTWSRKIANEMKKTRTSPRFKQSLTHFPNRAPDSTAI